MLIHRQFFAVQRDPGQSGTWHESCYLCGSDRPFGRRLYGPIGRGFLMLEFKFRARFGAVLRLLPVVAFVILLPLVAAHAQTAAPAPASGRVPRRAVAG